jgi:hypothetical protein
MAWGAKRGVADIIDKLVANSPAFHTQYILSTRTFGQAEAVALAQALRCNTTLRELYASGHDIGVEGATAEAGEARVASGRPHGCALDGDTEFGPR